MTDEFQIRQTAKDLLCRFKRLEEAKTMTMPSPEIKTGGGAFGSKTPGNDAAVDLDHDLCIELYEMVCNAIEEIQPTTIMHKNGVRMAGWIRWHAYDCAQLDWADDLQDLMDTHIKRIDRLIAPVSLGDMLRSKEEPWQYGGVIIGQLKKMGHKHTIDDLYTWASRGNINTRKRGNRATYQLKNVTAYIESRQLTD
ncbi:hypothetical protein BRL53_09060 [Corynebacterium ulcerans]|uniref:hypothetical protein n=1 Tax=Corynebacterium ulcerans TaxID=65058 RepID=UPI000C788358|nr:hypothetical protein [Corynebacterium ulcerans]PLV98769.1 hypothetical protein BRL53_09060 [Corynebacterium ulcerans]